MSREHVAAMIRYVWHLAPSFFSSRARPASDGEIERLEQSSGSPMSDGQREFLRSFGNTPCQVLNPFLGDLDWSIETLMTTYRVEAEGGWRPPSGIVYFSASTLLGSNVFLRNGPAKTDDPELGDLGPAGFVRHEYETFENYLGTAVGGFAGDQLEHRLSLAPPWSSALDRFDGDREGCERLLVGEGFTVIEEPSGPIVTYLERDEILVSLFYDGSLSLFGDDLSELQTMAKVLEAVRPFRATRVPDALRSRAPRE